MDTDKLYILLQAIDHRSLSAAGERLGYTPSGVSRAIASLEAEIGFSLLHRGRFGVSPTDECKRLMPCMRRLLSLQEQLKQEIDSIQGLETGTLVIGCSYGSYYRDYLAEPVAEFTRKHPGIQIDLFEGTSTELMQALAEGRGELCLISRREGDFDWIPLGEEELVAVLPLTHPLAKEKAYPLKRVSEDPFIEMFHGIETDNSRMMKELNLHPNIRFTCTDTWAALSMAEAGLGVVLLNESHLQQWQGDTVSLSLEPRQTVEIGIAVPAVKTVSPVVKAFLDEVTILF